MQTYGRIPFSPRVRVAVTKRRDLSGEGRAGSIEDRRFAVGAIRVAFSYTASRCRYIGDGVLLFAMVVCRGLSTWDCIFAMQCIRGTEE